MGGWQLSDAARTSRALALTVVGVIGLIAGCASDHDRLVQQGYPEAYAAGFDDGCASGRKAGGDMFAQFVKDVPRSESDDQYGEGWNDGFAECKGEQEAQAREFQQSLEQQQLEAQRKQNQKAHDRALGREAAKGLSQEEIDVLRQLQ